VVKPLVRLFEVAEGVIKVLRQLQNDVTDVGFAGYPDVLSVMTWIGLVLTMLGSAMPRAGDSPPLQSQSCRRPAQSLAFCACVTAASTLTVIGPPPPGVPAENY